MAVPVTQQYGPWTVQEYADFAATGKTLDPTYDAAQIPAPNSPAQWMTFFGNTATGWTQYEAQKQANAAAAKSALDQQKLMKMYGAGYKGTVEQAFPWGSVGIGLGALAAGGLLLYFILKKK